MQGSGLFRHLSFLTLGPACYAASFGTVVPVRGTVSDLELDESRGRLYLGQLQRQPDRDSEHADLSFGSPVIPASPGAIALSPDSHYLVAEYYAAHATPSARRRRRTRMDYSSSI